MKEIQEKKCGECYKNKWNFEPEISSIFHFELVNDGWISHILYVSKEKFTWKFYKKRDLVPSEENILSKLPCRVFVTTFCNTSTREWCFLNFANYKLPHALKYFLLKTDFIRITLYCDWSSKLIRVKFGIECIEGTIC